MSFFQLIVTIVFASFIVVGVGVFALFGGLGGSGSVGAVTIWGTLPQEPMQRLIEDLRQKDDSFQDVRYEQRSEEAYQSELINAIASGAGPDLFFVSQEDIQSFADKVLVIPYASVSQATILNSFVEEGGLLLTAEGAFGLPFLIDPLVMYWNRDLFSSAGVAQPPAYWGDFLTLAPKVTSLDSASNVKRSAVSLGTWSNIKNAKAILATLFMQAGDPIVGRTAEGELVAHLGTNPSGATENPAASALRFYTEFANPRKTAYSWNRSLPEAQDAFVAGNAAVYFGFASELGTIAGRNPNLRFGVAPMPQIEGRNVRITYGSLTALSIPRGAKNPQGAIVIAQKLTDRAGVAAAVLY